MRRLQRAVGFGLSGVVVAGALAACGAGTRSSTAQTAATSAQSPATATTTTIGTTAAPSTSAPSTQLVVTAHSVLPDARSGGAAAAFNSQIVFSGGLSAAGTSTDTVFSLAADRRAGRAASAGTLPGPAHDAAAAQLGSALLLFGGGRSEGSDRIVRVLPGPAKIIGRIPQALSDLDAVVVGDVAYVIGGWNGTATNRSIYAVTLGSGSGSGAPGAGVQVRNAAQLPLGVRYPAAGALAGHVIIAGGETTSGTPTADAWSFDPASGAVTRLPSLPAPTDHAPGAVLNGRFYLLGGLRRGSFSSTILSWAPGEHRWRTAGRLPSAVSDAAAVSLANEIVVLGGRGGGGTVADVTRLAARTP
jgi:hypothetical protein